MSHYGIWHGVLADPGLGLGVGDFHHFIQAADLGFGRTSGLRFRGVRRGLILVPALGIRRTLHVGIGFLVVALGAGIRVFNCCYLISGLGFKELFEFAVYAVRAFIGFGLGV